MLMPRYNRFIESLAKPIHSAPVTITELSEMFQQFYGSASQAISKHVANSHLFLASKKRTSTKELLSSAEIEQKRRDRKLLEAKKIALEEAIERKATEGVYTRIFRHESTDDEARDDSLQSKIAALKVVGVDLEHLGVHVSGDDKKAEIDKTLLGAAAQIAQIDTEKYPLGKLALLKAAHKTIVDCLTTHLTSPSADSLLPALIYALILSPPEPPLNAVSNLHFILRFRTSHFIDGEAAYCLTNLEAAISFLETVDLASLNLSAHDPSRTPSITSRRNSNSSSHNHSHPPLSKPLPPSTATSLSPAPGSHTPLRPPTRERKLTFPSLPLDLVTSTADQSLRTLSTALEGSYKFLFDSPRVAHPTTLEDARKIIDTPANSAEGHIIKHEASSDSLSVLVERGKARIRRATSASLGTQDTNSSRGVSPSGHKRDPSPAPSAGSNASSSAMPIPTASSSPSVTGLGLRDGLREIANTPLSENPLKHLGSSLGRFASGVGGGVGGAFSRGFSRTSVSSTPPPPASVASPGKGEVKEKKEEAEEEGEDEEGATPGVKDLLKTFPDLAGRLDGAGDDGAVRMKGDVGLAALVDMQSSNGGKKEGSECVEDEGKGGGYGGKEKVRVEEKWLKMEAGDVRVGEVGELLREYRRLVGELRGRGLA